MRSDQSIWFKALRFFGNLFDMADADVPATTAMIANAFGVPKWIGEAIGWLVVVFVIWGLIGLLGRLFGWVDFFTKPFQWIFVPLLRWGWTGSAWRKQHPTETI